MIETHLSVNRYFEDIKAIIYFQQEAWLEMCLSILYPSVPPPSLRNENAFNSLTNGCLSLSHRAVCSKTDFIDVALLSTVGTPKVLAEFKAKKVDEKYIFTMTLP